MCIRDRVAGSSRAIRRRRQDQEHDMSDKPAVLFVCVHNAGRSQMAAGLLHELAGDRIDVYSAGSQPADQINPSAVAAMAEVGIDIAGGEPKILTEDAVKVADVVITMGCGDECPYFPGKRYECLLYTSPSPRDRTRSRMPSSA